MSLEFQRSTYYDRVNKIIDSLVLKNSPSDNEIIKNRFLYEVMNYEYKRDSINKYYNVFFFCSIIDFFARFINSSIVHNSSVS